MVLLEQQGYNADERRKFIERNLDGWGWVWDRQRKGFLKSEGALSYREIIDKVMKRFALPKPVSTATIKRDFEHIAKTYGKPTDEEMSDAIAMLEPELFPQWREMLFTDPSNRGPIVTPKHQMAWFWAIVGLALKIEIPEWVIDYLDLPETINDDIRNPEKMVSFVLLGPPRHGKTMLIMHIIIWLICKFPNIRIIYSNGTKPITAQQIQLLREMLENNEKLVEMYGPFKSDLTWSSEGFIVDTRTDIISSLTVRGVGKGGAILSLDADVILVDDPQQPEDANSEAQTERDYNWLGPGVMTRREPHTGFVGVGSHQPSMTGDIWSWIEEKSSDLINPYHTMVIAKVKAHDVEVCGDQEPHVDCLLWPDRRPWYWLETMRALLGDDVLFNAVYNQEARSADMKFFPEEVINGRFVPPDLGESLDQVPGTPGQVRGILDPTRSFMEPQYCHGLLCPQTLGFDPAASERRGSSLSAATILGGCPRCRRVYLVDYWNERVSPEHHPDILLRFFAAYPGLERCRIEDNAYQKSLARNKRLVEGAARARVNIDEWTTDERKHDPRLGIPMMARTMRTGFFSVPQKTREDIAYGEAFLRALKRWPKKPNDIPMSLWLAMLSMNELFDEYTYMTPEVMPGAHRSEWHERTDVVVDLTTIWDDPRDIWE